MRQKGTIALFQYWDRLRNGRAAPRRTEIEPADIKALLADTFILERDMRGEAVFRLAGTRLCAAFGRELKGFSFASLWIENDRTLAAKLAAGALQSKSVTVVGFDGFSTQGRQLGFELILLPLDGGAESPRTLGSILPAERPFWLGADPLVECRVGSVRVVDPDREPIFLKNRPAIEVPTLAPDHSSLSAMPARGRRIRHLVVFDGGREDGGEG